MNNDTAWFKLTAGKDGIVRVRDNFGGRTPVWSPAALEVKKVGDNFEIPLRRGGSIEATFATPAAVPPAPAGAAEPLIRQVP